MRGRAARLSHTSERSCLLKKYDVYELSLGCWSSGPRNLYMCQVSSSTVFFFVSYMHIHVPFIMYCTTLFVVFQERNCLHTFKHDVVRRVTQFHLSTKFVSAAVSEICELNWKKKNSKIGYFHLSWAYLTVR